MIQRDREADINGAIPTSILLYRERSRNERAILFSSVFEHENFNRTDVMTRTESLNVRGMLRFRVEQQYAETWLERRQSESKCSVPARPTLDT